MRLNYLANAIGLVMMYIGLVIFLPALVALLYQDYSSFLPFFYASVVSSSIGYSLKKIVPNAMKVENLNDIKKGEALFVVSMSWIIFSIIAAIPYLSFGLSPINALFEAVSGITTTGASILTHFDYPKAFFFWRSFTQWLGGLGIIVLFIAVLPQFAVAGRQMFFAETPGPTEDKFTPRIRNTASALWKVYLGFTILEVILLSWFGMPVFEAVCTSLSTVSAGGFSPNQYSLISYHSSAIIWIILIFMFFAGASFNLQFKVLLQKNPLLFFKNEEFKMYSSLVFLMAFLIAVSLFFHHHTDFLKNFTDALFQVISVSTSTGFACVDVEKWNYTSKVILFIAMFTGSCASSAGGGIKMARWLVVYKTMKTEIMKILHPNAIVNIKLDNKTVPVEVSRQIVVFVFFYFLIFGISAIIMSVLEQNTAVGLTGAITSLGNIGLGVAVTTGPLGNYDGLHWLTKIIYIMNMFIGRLEIIPFLMLLQKEFWTIKD